MSFLDEFRWHYVVCEISFTFYCESKISLNFQCECLLLIHYTPLLLPTAPNSY